MRPLGTVNVRSGYLNALQHVKNLPFSVKNTFYLSTSKLIVLKRFTGTLGKLFFEDLPMLLKIM